MKELLLVGGDFDRKGGRKSSLITIISTYFEQEGYKVRCVNGGSFDDLKKIYESFKIENQGIVLWFPNVLNDEEKIRDIKTRAPHLILVTSKRNNNEYGFAEIVNRMLAIKSNLLLEFSLVADKPKPLYKGSVYDPLGNQWVSSTDFAEVVHTLAGRLDFLVKLTRQKTVYCEGEVKIPDEGEFFKLIKGYANTFHNLIQPVEEVKRFLGNASFRCERGFPSFRLDDNLIFVSRRNVDKRYIDKDNFVAVRFDEDAGENGIIYYYGGNKPSVDTPIQVRLYKKYPHINYMLHSHCYIEGVPHTSDSIPCGAIEEVKQITDLVSEKYQDNSDYLINLKGHGSIALVRDWKSLKKIKYIVRPLPEIWTMEV